MKAHAWVIAAVLAAPLIGLLGYIVYDQRKQSHVREYYEALSQYQNVIEAERRAHETQDHVFDTNAHQIERNAYDTGGEYARDQARIKNDADRKTIQIQREIDRIKRENGPPSKELTRLREAAVQAGMPLP